MNCGRTWHLCCSSPPWSKINSPAISHPKIPKLIRLLFVHSRREQNLWFEQIIFVIMFILIFSEYCYVRKRRLLSCWFVWNLIAENSAGAQRQDELLETNLLLKVVAHCIERGKSGFSPISTFFAPVPDAPKSKQLTDVPQIHDYSKSAPLELLLHAMLLVSDRCSGSGAVLFKAPTQLWAFSHLVLPG